MSKTAKPRVPLALKPPVPAAVAEATLRGTEAYGQSEYQTARVLFEQAVTGFPTSAEAHYNLGLALFALGAGAQAKQHFIEAANLAPGDKVIWDSPALRPFGSPEPTITKQAKDNYATQRPTFGGTPQRY